MLWLQERRNAFFVLRPLGGLFLVCRIWRLCSCSCLGLCWCWAFRSSCCCYWACRLLCCWRWFSPRSDLVLFSSRCSHASDYRRFCSLLLVLFPVDRFHPFGPACSLIVLLRPPRRVLASCLDQAGHGPTPRLRSLLLRCRIFLLALAPSFVLRPRRFLQIP